MKLIACINQDGIIGIDNELPWHIPSDLAHFKVYTTGKCVIMGRKTFESLNSKPLPNRTNVVVSRTLVNRDVIVERLVKRLPHYRNAIVIGGEALYKEVLELDLIEEICLTQVNIDVDTKNKNVSYFPTEYLKNFSAERRIYKNAENYTITYYVRKPNEESKSTNVRKNRKSKNR